MSSEKKAHNLTLPTEADAIEMADVGKISKETEELTVEQKLQAAKKRVEEEKKKSIAAYVASQVKQKFGFRDLVKFMWPRIWRSGFYGKFLVVFNCFITLVLKMLTVSSPLLLRLVINGMICQQDDGDVDSDKPIEVCPTSNEVYMYIGFYVGTTYLVEVIKSFREIPWSNMSAIAEISIAHDLYNHVQRQSLGYHLSRSTGKIVRQVAKGQESFVKGIRMVFFQFYSISVEIILCLIIFGVFFSWEFIIVQAAAVYLYFFVTFTLTNRRTGIMKEMSKADNRYNQVATDSLMNFETVKYFNAEEHEETRFDAALDSYMDKFIKVAIAFWHLNATQGLMIAIGIGSMLSLAYRFVIRQTLDIGGFVMFQQYCINIFTSMANLGVFARMFKNGMVNVEELMNLMALDESIPESDFPIVDNTKGGEIEFRNVSFTYDQKLAFEDQRTILDGISFKVPAGSSVGIVGQTGSGKSTIMRLIYRFYDIQQGSILIDGQDITKLKISDLRSNIAIVPQDCVLFNDNILYNIAYGGMDNDSDIKDWIDDPSKQEDLIRKIIPSAKRSQIHKFVMGQNWGYYTKVGERGLKLSGGEKQRVAIARALLKSSPIMCFDEATSALDTQTEREIQSAINEVSKDSTTLIIAHRLSTVRDCDKIIVLKFGVIVEQGAHDDLLKIEGGHYRNLWEKQSEQKASMAKE